MNDFTSTKINNRMTMNNLLYYLLSLHSRISMFDILLQRVG